MLSIKGKFQNGVAHPAEPVEEREGQLVIITFLDEVVQNVTQAEGWGALLQLVEECTVDIGIPDLARHHDHYLYGKPKQE